MTAYYNEIDPFAAEWLRALIAAGHIAPGHVDTRSIVDVRPNDLVGYTQCHFFAGIGVWSYALRRAGWPDHRPIWTGSCPCQPFSSAGKGGGFDDERHLWPYFHYLIRECGPSVVAGEQVASKDGLAWLDLVQADMEGTGYAFGAVDTCAAGFGAPHIRQRQWWIGERAAGVGLADPCGPRLEGQDARALGHERAALERGGWFDGVADDDRNGRTERREIQPVRAERDFEHGRAARRLAYTRGGGWAEGLGFAEQRLFDTDSAISRLDDTVRVRRGEGRTGRDRRDERQQLDAIGGHDGTGPTNGFWRNVDWLFCRDDKWRPVEPGTFPLANGASARVGRLRGYGNAINAAQAQGFIEAYLETKAIDATPDGRDFRLTELSVSADSETDQLGIFG